MVVSGEPLLGSSDQASVQGIRVRLRHRLGSGRLRLQGLFRVSKRGAGAWGLSREA